MIRNLTIRTRFAPSPTGNLHIGGARTALFNFLFAKKNKGQFILRIEDTDLKRSKEEFVESLNKDLDWLKLQPDESSFISHDELTNKGKYYGPYKQSERKTIYKKHIDELLTKRKAYFCFCSEEDLRVEKEKFLSNNKRKNYQYSQKCLFLTKKNIKERLQKSTNYLVRFLVNKDEEYGFKDLLRGNITIKGEDLEDFVIYRSDQTPLYNLAAVIDDHLMNITHVIRGEDHITNTHKQIALYKAFDWKSPNFVHLAVILNKEKQKLSKRDLESDQFQQIEQLRKEGYLPEAITNYLLFLGWNPKTTQEFFTLEESINFFNIEGLQPSGAVFDINKLNWYNKHYIKKMSINSFEKFSTEFVNQNCNWVLNKVDCDKLKKTFLLFKTQINCFQDLIPLTRSLFIEPIELKTNKEEERIILKTLLEKFEETVEAEWTEEKIKEILEKVIICKKKKEVYPLLREILIQKKQGLGLSTIIYCLEKKTVIKRLIRSL